MSYHDLTHIAAMGRPEYMEPSRYKPANTENGPWEPPKDDMDDLIDGYRKAPSKTKYWQRMADHYGKHRVTVSNKVFKEMDRRGIKR